MKNAKQKINWWFIIFLLTFIALIPLWVYLIANYSWIELANDKNEIGDALGGITNPIIGIGGIILTFIAFYVQYQFNKEQSARIDKERDERISEKEINELKERVNYLKAEITNIENMSYRTIEKLNNIRINDFSNRTLPSFNSLINEFIYLLKNFNHLCDDISLISKIRIDDRDYFKSAISMRLKVKYLYSDILSYELISLDQYIENLIHNRIIKDDDIVISKYKELRDNGIHPFIK